MCGSGIPIIIVGFGSYTFKLFSEELKSKYQFILHDFYGLTQSDIDYDLSIENIIYDIKAIQDFLKIEKMNILGHSSSGTVALDYTLLNMDSVDKLFMVCSPIIYNYDYFQFQQKNQKRNMTEERKKALERNLAEFEKRKDQNLVKDFFKEFHIVQTPIYFYDLNYSVPDHWNGIPVNPDFINNFIDKIYNVYERKIDFMTVKEKLVSFAGRFDLGANFFR